MKNYIKLFVIVIRSMKEMAISVIHLLFCVDWYDVIESLIWFLPEQLNESRFFFFLFSLLQWEISRYITKISPALPSVCTWTQIYTHKHTHVSTYTNSETQNRRKMQLQINFIVPGTFSKHKWRFKNTKT